MFRKHFKRDKSKPTSRDNGAAIINNPSSAKQPPATLPGHMRPEDDPFSDPESSLYDYERANEPGYATVDFGTLERRRRLAEQQRGQHPVPSSDVNENNNSGNMVASLEAVSTSRTDLDNLYSMPFASKSPKTDKQPRPMKRSSAREGRQSQRSVRSIARADTGIGGSLRDTTGEVQQAMRALHTLPVDHASEPKVVRSHMLNSSPNHRQHGPSSRNGDAQVLSQLEHRVVELQQQNDDLVAQNDALTKVADALNVGDTETAQTTLLRKQIQDIKDERETLKTSVHRLNVELSKYQAKYRPVTYGKDSHDIVGLPSKGPIPSWLINTKYLAPLFLAYDDQITAKENLIQQYKNQLDSLKSRAQEVIQENERLRLRGASSEQLSASGPTTPAEWQLIQEQARLVLEENQVLMEQLDVQQHKSSDMAAAHSQQVARLSRQLVASEASKAEAENDLEQMKVKYKELKVLVDQTLVDSPVHITTHEHTRAIDELKRTICEQKEKHDKAIGDSETKLQAMTLERNDLALKVTDLTAEVKQLEGQLSTVDKAFRKYESHIQELYSTIEKVQKEELSSQQQLANIIKVAEKTAFERDTYAKVAKDQEEETRKAFQKLLVGNITVGKLQEKLKQYRLKAASKLSTIADQMKEMDSSFDSQREEFAREIRHLQLLVKEKDILLQSAEADKEQVEQDLEVMWQATSCETERMKESLKRSYRRIERAATATVELDQDDADPGDISSVAEGE